MAIHNGTTVEESGFFPGAPREKKEKKWIYPVAAGSGVAGLVVGGGLVYKSLTDDIDETKVNAASDPPKKNELFMAERPKPAAEIRGDKLVVKPSHPASEPEEKPINWNDPNRPFDLGGLARSEGRVIYPDKVDVGPSGKYLYDFKKIDQLVLAFFEGLNSGDRELIAKLTGIEDGYDRFKNKRKIESYKVESYGVALDLDPGQSVRVMARYDDGSRETYDMGFHKNWKGDLRLR
jgi:hypothetical protein